MINLASEKYSDVIEEIKPLLHNHWLEIARHRETIPLNPNYEKYVELEKVGALHIATLRDDGKLKGYCISFIQPHLHYMDCLMALNDILFIDKEYRRGTNAIRLIKFTEQALKEVGVMKSHITMKIAHDFGPVLERMGYTAIEKVYEKML